MASISKDKSGNRTIQFIGPDKRRRSVRLGKIDADSAKKITKHIEHLSQCWKFGEAPCPQTFEWISTLLSDPARVWLYDRLAAVKLLIPREVPEEDEGAEIPKLGPFLTAHIDSRGDLKESTKTNLRQVRDNLIRFFGDDKPLQDVSPGDADDFRQWLRGDLKLAENTIRKRCQRAKQFFRAALRKRLLTENPFGDMKDCSVKGNKMRSSRATELAKIYPEWMVAAWCGHDPKIAREHYWQITEADWERAATEPTDATHADKAVQNAVQLGSGTGAESRGEAVHSDARKPGKNREKCEETVTPTGLEPVLPA